MQTADWRPRLELLLEDFRRRQKNIARNGDKPDRIQVARSWHADLVDHELAAPGWPREVGGLELPLAISWTTTG
jgi:acyl-CoA dehydrogenase